MKFHRYSVTVIFLAVSACAMTSRIATAVQSDSSTVKESEPKELPTLIIPHPGSAAEAYFSPDGGSLVCNAKL